MYMVSNANYHFEVVHCRLKAAKAKLEDAIISVTEEMEKYVILLTDQ